MPRLAERADALINPLMLKETYQGFRSGALRVIASFALILPLLILGSFLGIGAYEKNEVEESGRGLFTGIMSALVVLGALFAPVRAAQQLQGEIKSHTTDLILLTAMTPWQLAFGRFQAAVLQVTLLFALALPFQVACVAIGGVSIEVIVEAVVATFAVSLFQCAAALTGATMYLVSRRLGGFATVMAVGYGLVVMGVLQAHVRGSSYGAEASVWLVSILLLNTVLFLRLSADLLTPISTRTFAWSKACLAALLAVLFMPLWLGDARLTQPERFRLLGAGLGLLYLFGFGWSATALRRTEAASRWRRLLDDGYDPTLVYCGAINALVAGVAAVRGWPAGFACLFFVYFVFITGLAALVHGLLPKTSRTTQAYVNTVALLLGIEAMGTAMSMSTNSPDLVQALSMVFPIGLFAPRFNSATVLSYVVPLQIGAAAILLARWRNARVAHG